MLIPVRFVLPLPIVTMSWGSCADSFLRPSSLYVVLYIQEELCVLTCPRCTLPYWESRVKPWPKLWSTSAREKESQQVPRKHYIRPEEAVIHAMSRR